MATIGDKFSKVSTGVRPLTTTVDGTRATSGGTLSCADLTGWDTDTAVHGVTYKINGQGAIVTGSQIDFKGIVSGNTITNFTVTGGTDAGNAVGDIVQATPTAAWAKDLADGLIVSHDQDGTLKAGAVDNAAALASNVVTTAKILDSNVTTAKIADGNVTNAKLATGSGEPGGAYTSYTPSFTNFTLGNGTIVYAKWKQVGKHIHCRGRVLLGTTSSMTGILAVSTPVAAASDYNGEDTVGTASVLDGGTLVYPGWVTIPTANTFGLSITATAAGANPVFNGNRAIQNGTPIAWGDTDAFQWNAVYEAA